MADDECGAVKGHQRFFEDAKGHQIKSLVGSSRSKTLAPSSISLAKSSRIRSPPERLLTRCSSCSRRKRSAAGIPPHAHLGRPR